MHGQPEFDLFEAIYTTRSMRRLRPDPVAPAVIVRIIEAATMGPSGSNRQPWTFVVVTDAQTRAQVAERYRKAWEVYFRPQMRARLEREPDSPQSKIIRSAKYLAEHIGEVPVMIFACVKRYHDAARKGQPMWGAIFPAVQNLCLAARAYGLGTSITGLHMMFAGEIDEKLGVPSDYANVALIPLGYPRGRWGRPQRKPALGVTFWNKWGVRRERVE
ncbi:MAG: nitroreductase family protein [Candidatus Binataceae bacterium]